MSAATLTKAIGFKLPSAASYSSRLVVYRCASCLSRTRDTQSFGSSQFVNMMNVARSSTSTSSSNDSQAAAEAEKYILLDRRDDKGVITLNRPKALNALNYHMAHRLEAGLKVWDNDSQIRMVMIKSASEKSFCAGGDVKAITLAGKDEGKKFFRQEYTLNNLIGSLSVPYVALIDGIVMGGGCGLSVHGNFRVVTEKALFAMPETAIGLFPDVGASHFLNKLPGSLGLYFGLTGVRMQGRDLFKAGIGTHFVPSDKLKNLEDELLRLEKPDLLKIDRILQKYQEQWQDEFRKEFSLKPHIGRINSIFGQAKQMEEVISGLERDNSEWARKHLDTLAKMSPTSLKLTFEQLKRAKTMTLPECLKMEFRLACRVLENKEFYEGVRAVLIEKDNKPKWDPAKLEQVQEAQINAYFEPLPRNEELQL